MLFSGLLIKQSSLFLLVGTHWKQHHEIAARKPARSHGRASLSADIQLDERASGVYHKCLRRRTSHDSDWRFEKPFNQRAFSSQPTLFKQVQGKINANTQSQWSDFIFVTELNFSPNNRKRRFSTLLPLPDSRAQYVIFSLCGQSVLWSHSSLESVDDPFLLFRDYIALLAFTAILFWKKATLTAQSNEQTHILRMRLWQVRLIV